METIIELVPSLLDWVQASLFTSWYDCLLYGIYASWILIWLALLLGPYVVLLFLLYNPAKTLGQASCSPLEPW